MIGTVKKPLKEVLEALAGYQKVAVVGCDGCAKVAKSGGSDEVAEMAGILAALGKNIVFMVTPERTCNIMKAHESMDPLKDQAPQAEAMLVLGCGGAVQIVRQVTEEYGLAMPVKTGLDSVGHMDMVVAGTLALEQ